MKTLGQTPDYSRTQSFRRRLVSNADEKPLKEADFVSKGALGNPVFMVNRTTPDSSDSRVEAGRVPVGSRRFASWVGDENGKALTNPRDDSDRKETVPAAELLAGFATPGSHGVLAVDGFQTFSSDIVTVI